MHNEWTRKIATEILRRVQIAGLKKQYLYDPTEIVKIFSSLSRSTTTAALDIGSGPTPKNPFKADRIFGADLRANSDNNVVYADIAAGTLPFDNEAFDYVTAHDVLEHVLRVVVVSGGTRFPFIDLINEVFRVLKPGGIFFNIQPCYPAKEAFQDPTHVNIMSEDTMDYYFCERAWARIYGYEGSFEMVNDGWIDGKYYSFMKKVSDEPIRDLNFIQR